MSIALKDGTTLPDIPAGYEDYLYSFVFSATVGGSRMIGLALLKNEPCFITADLSGKAFNYVYVPAGGYVLFAASALYYDEWEFSEEKTTVSDLGLGTSNNITTVLEWTNFDLKYASSVGDDGVPVIGTKIYFKEGIGVIGWPEFPEGCFDGTPYGVIVQQGDACGLVASQAPGFISSFEDVGELMICAPAGNLKMFVWIPTLSEWMLQDELVLPEIEVMTSVSDAPVIWSNYDVLYATSKNDDGTYTIGTEIYFPSSVKPPLILPDGTKLPPLPDGCFNGTPYGVIFFTLYAYALLCSPLPFGYISKEVGSAYDITQNAVGTMSKTGKLYYAGTSSNEWIEDDWIYPALSNADHEHSYFVVSNHDVYAVNAFDMTAETVDFGELWHKSDINYRITDGWMRSIANETRKIGKITNGLTIDDIETTLRSSELFEEYTNAMEVSF